MCGSSHSSSSNAEQGLNKLAGITPVKSFGEFKVGDRATGLASRGVESTRGTGVIADFENSLGVTNQIATITLDVGGTQKVWSDTLQFSSFGFQVGDYVTGWDDPDQDDEYGNSYVGEITQIDSKDGQNVELRDKDNDTIWVYYSTLSPAERPAPAIVEAGPALTAGATAATAIDVTETPAAPLYLVEGTVDFNKELFGSNENLTDIKVVAYVPGADYPFVVSFENSYGITTVGTFDADGDHTTDSDFNLRNAHELPDVVFLVIYRDTDNDDQIGVLEEVFDSETSAKSAYLDSNLSLLGVLPVYPKELEAKRVADKAAAEAVAANDDNDDGVGSTNTGDAGASTSDGLSEVSLYINGSGYSRLIPGQVIWAERRGFSKKRGKIVKIRSHASKQILFQPDDGAERYYALNKSLRMG